MILQIIPAQGGLLAVFAGADELPYTLPVVAFSCHEVPVNDKDLKRVVCGMVAGDHIAPADSLPGFIGYCEHAAYYNYQADIAPAETFPPMPVWVERAKAKRAAMAEAEAKKAMQKIVVPNQPVPVWERANGVSL